jgi:alcohol dehydrogenase YqhD (iron-dependent ADH family)
MRYCFENDVEKFERFGKEIFHLDGKPTIVASDGIHYFMDWIHTQLQLSTSLCDLGIRAEEVELIAKNNSISYPLGTLRELNQNDVMHILRLSNY